MKVVLFLLSMVKFMIEVKASTCGVVPITEWGDSPLQRDELLPGPITIAVIQHTATQECKSDEECERVLGAIRNYQIRQGFCDIGPSFLIGGNGKVYEGAGWHYVGAHTLHYNRRAFGFSFIGDFSSKLPSPLAIRALRNLLACGVRHKYLTEGYHMVAHSQLSNTASPGEMLRKQVEMWPHWLDHAKEILD